MSAENRVFRWLRHAFNFYSNASASQRRRRRRQTSVESLEVRTLLSAFTVTNLNDSGSGSLRAAIASANGSVGADTISFAVTGTILLSSGELLITDSVTITGPGADQLALSGNNQAFRVFAVDDLTASFIDVAISDLTIRDGGNGIAALDGAGVRSSENLTMSGVIVTGNEAGSQGGGGIQIYGGNFVLQNSAIIDNRANQGAGVELFGNSHLIINTTVSGNEATGHGGGVLALIGPTTVRNSTITMNRCDADGNGVGVNGGAGGNPDLLTAYNTIVAGNFIGTGTQPYDAANLNSSSSYNLIGFAGADVGLTNGVNGNIVGVNGSGLRDINTILNTTLANNGGRTPTHALVAGSAALNSGSNAQALTATGGLLVNDQRGTPMPRTSGSAVDIGAYELFAGPIIVSTTVDELDSNLAAGDLSLREAIALANGTPGANVITFAGSTNGTEFDLQLGQMLISDAVTITGNGSGLTVIDAQQLSRIFFVTDTAGDVTLQSMKLRRGRTTGSNADFNDSTFGGGAVRTLSAGTLTFSNCIVTENSTSGLQASGGAVVGWTGMIQVDQSTFSGNGTTGNDGAGGAISAKFGPVIVTRSIFDGNSTLGTSAVGGAIFAVVSDITISDSTFSSNQTSGVGAQGGAVFNQQRSITITNSTFSGNSTSGFDADGGAVMGAYAPMTIRQSTFSGNSTAGVFADGGAIFTLSGAFSLIQSTVIGNSSLNERGGGVFVGSAPSVVRNSIIAANTDNGTAPDFLQGSTLLLTIGNSLIGRNNGTGLSATGVNAPDGRGNFVGGATPVLAINPLAGFLQSNGGATLTRALLPGSPALDRGASIADILIKPTSVVSATAATDFYPADRLLSATNLTLQNFATADDDIYRWVTNDPNGAAGNDYFANGTATPTLTFSLGATYLLTDVVLWGYQDSLNNDSKSIRFEFSTDGGSSFNATITLTKPRFSLAVPSHTLSLGAVVAANTIRMTILDNYFGEAGDTGGDRVGLDEVRFLQRGLTPISDQRGGSYARILDSDLLGGPVVDMGAVESPGIRVISPNPNAFTLRPTYTWTPVAGATEYTIQINNDSTGVAQFHVATVTTASYTPGIDLAVGKFRMWIRPKFGVTLGNWSAPQTFYILAAPAWQTIARTQLTSRPSLAWNALPGAVQYDLWVTNYATGQPVVRQNVNSTGWTPSSDLTMGLYRAWVRGRDAAGNYTAWSVLQELLVVPGPTPIGPMNSTFDRTPTFQWNAVAGAGSYELYVRNRNTGALVINGQAVAGTSYTPVGNLADGPYRWWAVAVSPANVGSIKSGGTTPTDIYVGGQTTLIVPTGTISNRTPTFTWRTVDGATSYHLWVNRVDIAVAGIINVTGLLSTAFTPVSPLAAGTYRAWVRSVSSTGELSIWSAQVDFTIV